ncbi:hypothetical protein [Dactylosporangium sp. CA-092794]|uniref:hypothetical protein n=1 Tax=Dactylosporangium sp. CA-092794 TaxID=3239929 RepID=UPI003D8EAF30
MRTRTWQCVAGAALVVGTLSAAQAAREPHPPMVARSQATTEPRGPAEPPAEHHRTAYLLAGSGLLAIGGVVLVGGVAGLGGLRIPGGVSMGVARSRLWYRSVRRAGTHRAP